MPRQEGIASALLQLKNNPRLFKKWREQPGYPFRANGKTFRTDPTVRSSLCALLTLKLWIFVEFSGFRFNSFSFRPSIGFSLCLDSILSFADLSHSLVGLLNTMGTTDYTRLPIGTKLEEGEIQRCPYCGKPGYAQTISGKTYYTHSESISQIVNAAGSWKIDIKRVSCPFR